MARFNSPEMPFDGQYEEYDGSLPCASLHALWEEGYNFIWYCTKCHAEHFGLTSKEADLEHTRMLLGLRFHPYVSETNDNLDSDATPPGMETPDDVSSSKAALDPATMSVDLQFSPNDDTMEPVATPPATQTPHGRLPYESVKPVSHRRFPWKLQDDRFNPVQKERWFLCDRCHLVVKFNKQGLPFDGSWLNSKAGVPCCTHRGLWLAGENYLWYCTKCHAELQGMFTDSLSLRLVRAKLGILHHGANRNERWMRMLHGGTYGKSHRKCR
jgi:ribosomal protein L37AE/L43A